MRADAKVYVLQDNHRTVISINASLKNLIEKMIATRKFSRSCPDRKTTMATLKTGYSSIHPLKNGANYFITFKQLGDINDILIEEPKVPHSCSNTSFKPGELDFLVTEGITDAMIDICLQEVA